MPRKRAPQRRRPRLEVWKFGGASLADAAFKESTAEAATSAAMIP